MSSLLLLLIAGAAHFDINVVESELLVLASGVMELIL
jgi:hypothetical protein